MKNSIFLFILCISFVAAAMEQPEPEQNNETRVLIDQPSHDRKSPHYTQCVCCHETIDGIAENYGKVSFCVVGLAATAAVSALYATGNCPIQ